MYQIFTLFKQSSMEGYLGCFQFVAVTNKAIVNLGTGFHVNVNFHFPGTNAQGCDYWVI